MTTIMQLFQCDLQPQIQNMQRTTHTGTTTCCRTQRRNPLRSERPQPHPPHTGGTFHRRLQPLYTEKMHGCVLRLSPQHKPHATSMQPLQCTLQHHVANLHLSTLGNTRWQQSCCSHSNAICNHRFKTRKELRTQEQPLVAEHRRRNPLRSEQRQPHLAASLYSTYMATPNDNNHAAIPLRSATTDSKTRIELRIQEQPPVAEHRGGTHYARNDPSRTRRTQEVPFNAGCNHFSRRKNTRFRAPASSPSQVSHQPSLSVLLCDVRSHTTVSHHPSLSVLLCDPSLTPQTHTTLHWVYCCR